MKVLICSDSHQRLDYFDTVLKKEKPDMVIFAGDHSTDAIDISYAYDNIKFVIVRGNCDYFDNETEDTQFIELNGKKIFLTHGHLFSVKRNLIDLEKEASKNNADICIFGHTHIPLLVTKDDIIYLNPGALMDRRYAIYDGNEIQLKNL